MTHSPNTSGLSYLCGDAEDCVFDPSIHPNKIVLEEKDNMLVSLLPKTNLSSV